MKDMSPARLPLYSTRFRRLLGVWTTDFPVGMAPPDHIKVTVYDVPRRSWCMLALPQKPSRVVELHYDEQLGGWLCPTDFPAVSLTGFELP